MVMHHHLVDMYLLMVVQLLYNQYAGGSVDMDLVVNQLHMVEVWHITDLTILGGNMMGGASYMVIQLVVIIEIIIIPLTRVMP